VSVESTRPKRALSRRVTKGVRRKLKTKANAKGIKIRRPKYSIAIVRATATNIEDFEAAAELEERINARPPAQAGQTPLYSLSVQS
jgi:hypothetical protein